MVCSCSRGALLLRNTTERCIANHQVQEEAAHYEDRSSDVLLLVITGACEHGALYEEWGTVSS